MIQHFFSHVNYAAVATAAAAYFILGAVWYAVFAKPWMKAIGKSEEELKSGSKMIYIYTLLIEFVAVWALAGIIHVFGAQGFADGATVGAVTALVFSMGANFTNGMFGYRSWMLMLIDGGYHVAGCFISGGILGAWQ